MSLLLDALNRASKEKQKAAAAASQAEAPAAVPAHAATPSVAPSAPVEPLQWEEIPRPTPTAEQAAPVDAPRAAPPVLTTPVQSGAELELTLVMDASPTIAPAPTPRFEPAPIAQLSPPPEAAPIAPAAANLVGEPTLEPSPAPVAQAGPAIEPEVSSAAKYAPAPVPEPAVSTPREPTLAAPKPPAPQAPPAPSEPVPVQPPPVAASAPVAPVAPVEPPLGLAPASVAKSAPDGQMAQDIRRAYEGPASDARKGRRRAMALGGLAIGLALAFGSAFLGLWGDPAKWTGGSGLTTVAPLTPVAIQEPAVPAEAAVSVASASASAANQVPTTVALSAPEPLDSPAKPVGGAKTVSSGEGASTAPNQTQVLGDAPPKLAAATTSASATTPSAVSLNASSLSSGNDVVLGGNARSNPNFVAKIRGPSPLEQGYALLLQGRLDEAAQAYGQALRANADERDALLGMAYISQQKGQRDDAQTYYRRVLRQEPNNTRALAALQALDSASDPTLTASRTGDLAARQPDSAAAMAMAGNAFVRDGLLSNAAQAYARAQILEPTNPLHAYNHAVALDRLGRYAQAVVQYERVMALSANAPVAERAYQIEAVRMRLAQLRQALAVYTESAAP